MTFFFIENYSFRKQKDSFLNSFLSFECMQKSIDPRKLEFWLFFRLDLSEMVLSISMEKPLFGKKKSRENLIVLQGKWEWQSVIGSLECTKAPKERLELFHPFPWLPRRFFSFFSYSRLHFFPVTFAWRMHLLSIVFFLVEKNDC